ncbi:LIPOPROTEIN VSAE (FRAGMENT), partial [Mycoplasmopsis pulmonis]
SGNNSGKTEGQAEGSGSNSGKTEGQTEGNGSDTGQTNQVDLQMLLDSIESVEISSKFETKSEIVLNSSSTGIKLKKADNSDFSIPNGVKLSLSFQKEENEKNNKFSLGISLMLSSSNSEGVSKDLIISKFESNQDDNALKSISRDLEETTQKIDLVSQELDLKDQEEIVLVKQSELISNNLKSLLFKLKLENFKNAAKDVKLTKEQETLLNKESISLEEFDSLIKGLTEEQKKSLFTKLTKDEIEITEEQKAKFKDVIQDARTKLQDLTTKLEKIKSEKENIEKKLDPIIKELKERLKKINELDSTKSFSVIYK